MLKSDLEKIKRLDEIIERQAILIQTTNEKIISSNKILNKKV